MTNNKRINYKGRKINTLNTCYFIKQTFFFIFYILNIVRHVINLSNNNFGYRYGALVTKRNRRRLDSIIQYLILKKRDKVIFVL